MLAKPPYEASPLLDRLTGVFRLPKAEIERSLHPDFSRYFRTFIAGGDLSPYFREIAAIVSRTQWRGRVLDLGCGFGLTAICLRAFGSGPVVGLDFVHTKVATAARLARLIDARGIQFVRGDAEILPFRSQSLDGVLIKDAVSHLRADTSCYAEVYRILKPGGSLLIDDDRNALKRKIRRETHRMWDTSEFGNAQELAGVGMDRNFSQMRKEYLQERYPTLSSEDYDSLARSSRGYLNTQLPTFVENWKRKRPQPPPFADCVNPENGIVQERLINPFALVKQLDAIGFHAKLVPPAWKAKEGVLWEVAKRAAAGVWPCSIVLSSTFFVFATRKK